MEFFEKAWPFVESSDGVFTQKAAADKNRLRILGLIARRRCRSQRQLALATGLQPSTVSNIVRALKTQGLIREGAAIEAERAGPKETELDLVGDAFWCAGVSLDAVGHRIILVNASGHVLAQDSLSPGLPTNEILPRLEERIRACALQNDLEIERLGGIGVSVPGIVDTASGTVLISRSLGLQGFRLRDLLAAALGCPVWVERNVDCGAYAEHHAGVARDRDSFIYFLLRSDPKHPLAFGLSLVIGERIFHGCNSAAGEVDRNLLPEAVSGERSGRVDGAAAADRFYEVLANTLGGIINLLDIGCITLSTNDENLTTERFKRLEDAVANSLIPVPERRFDLLRSGMGIEGILLGGALLAAHRTLAHRANQTESIKKVHRVKQ